MKPEDKMSMWVSNEHEEEIWDRAYTKGWTDAVDENEPKRKRRFSDVASGIFNLVMAVTFAGLAVILGILLFRMF